MASSSAATTPNTFLLKNLKTFNPSRATTSKPLSITRVTQTITPPSISQDRVFNFAAGPATLPENVLRKAESELYNWRGVGMSVMKMSHRGKEFMSIINKAKSCLRKLLDISEDYVVLFLQGGATTQFAAITLNICKPDDRVDFIVSGSWGDKAYKEALKYCKPSVIWSGKGEKYTSLPSFESLAQDDHAKYLHICVNE